MCGHWLVPIFILGAIAMWRHHRRHHGRFGYGGCHGFRRHGGFGPFAGPGHPVDPVSSILNDLHLTPEQATAADEIIAKARAGAAEVHEALHALRSKLGSALRGESFDESAVGDVLAQLDGALDKARAHLLDTLARLHQVLDPSQRARLADWLERWERFRMGGISL